MPYLTDFSIASERLNLNNVAKVERKESLFSLPKCSNVSKKHRTKKSGVATEWEQHRFLQCGDRTHSLQASQRDATMR